MGDYITPWDRVRAYSPKKHTSLCVRLKITRIGDCGYRAASDRTIQIAEFYTLNF